MFLSSPKIGTHLLRQSLPESLGGVRRIPFRPCTLVIQLFSSAVSSWPPKTRGKMIFCSARMVMETKEHSSYPISPESSCEPPVAVITSSVEFPLSALPAFPRVESSLH